MFVTKKNGSLELLNISEIHDACFDAIRGASISEDFIDEYVSELEASAHLQFYDAIPTVEIQKTLIKTAVDKVSESAPEWSGIAANLLLRQILMEVKPKSLTEELRDNENLFCHSFQELDSLFDLGHLDKLLKEKQAAVDRDFEYLGLQILYDRYLLRNNGVLLETPARLYMRVCLGVCLNEENPTEMAEKFFHLLSTKKFSPATSTLFNSLLGRPQLSSCFLLTMEDSLEGIFESLKEAATYSKFSGGIGMDMGKIRSKGSAVNSTKGKSSGVIPYIKMLEETVRGFNQGGKRPGSAAVYIEPWHDDIYEFMDVRNTSGDERARAHDIFPALWIPDLFMDAVQKDGAWYLFNPGEFPELHELYGAAFEERYNSLVQQHEYTREVSAVSLWRLMIQRIFETGSYWPCFKDTINRRYSQVKSGVVHSSNLCTEITLRSGEDISAVCNLGSLNLSRITDGELSYVVPLAVRFLDNVLDCGVVPHKRGEKFNSTDRAIGLGVMGYAEHLYQRGVLFNSQEHLHVAHDLFEEISYHAINASADLATERGGYLTFDGSSWASGKMPFWSHESPEDVFECRLDWKKLSFKASRGMRNSCLLAIAPTSTISDIAGTTPCIELPEHNAMVRENLAGQTKIISPLLKYMKDPETFHDADMEWVIRAAAVRQKFLDQSQSLNLKVKNRPNLGVYISDMYFLAWKLGVKTTYYLKTVSKGHEEISGVCAIGNPECESCQ